MAKTRKYLACLLAVLMMFSLLPLQAAMATEVETAGEECTHPEESIVVDEAVPAGCETTGLTEGSHCGLCNKVLVEQMVTSALGHIPEETRRDAVEATADAAGYTGDLYCAVCEALLEEGEVIPQLVVEADEEEEKEDDECLHPVESIVVDEAVPAGCETTGLTEGSHCGLCNKVLVEQTVTSALGHTPEETRRNVVEATVDAAGYTGDLYCAVCEALLEEGEVIPQLVVEADGEEENEEDCLHPEESIVIDEAVPATSEADGLTEGSHCGLCNAVLVEQQIVHTPEETRRNAVEATEESEGYTGDLYCAVCGQLIEEGEVILKLEAEEEKPPEGFTVEFPGEFVDISGEQTATPDELYLAYFNKLLNGPSFRKSAAPRGDSLKGNDRKLYDYLKVKIAEIARGDEDSSFFAVPMAEIGFPADGTFTESDLELSGPFLTGVTWNNDVIDEAKAQIAAMIPDFSKVFTALRADFPYEIYWGGSGYGRGGYGFSIDPVKIDGVWHATITIYGAYNNVHYDSSLIYYHYTAQAYQNEDDPDQFTVDTDKTSAAANAVTSIENILAYANNNCSTEIEKLTYFKNKICELVVYNMDAYNAHNAGTYYNENAWELIWVFDGNSNTNVVCEGYAKAFKYLCDRAGLECYTVSGNMYGGTGGGGGHMWNIVVVNGERLLVDVTNCDDGTIGYPDKLFLKGVGPNEGAGSFDTYSFRIGSTTIYYKYDAETLSLYTPAELTLRGDEYVLITGRSLSLKGRIGFNFYFTFPEVCVGDAMSYAMVNDVRFDPDDMIEDSGQYRITYFVPAKNMHDEMTLKFYSCNDEIYPLKSKLNGVISAVDNYTFSFDMYQTLADDRAQSGDPQFTDSLMRLLDIMSAYGHGAKIVLENSSQSVNVTDEMQAVTVDTLSNYAYTVPQSGGGVQYVGSTLVLDANTDIHHYFKVSSGSIDDYVFQVRGQTVTPTQSGDSYYITISDIPAKNLDTAYTVTVKTAGGVTLFTIDNYSALSYAYKVLADNGGGNVNLVNLVKILYLYNLAANAYFES